MELHTHNGINSPKVLSAGTYGKINPFFLVPDAKARAEALTQRLAASGSSEVMKSIKFFCPGSVNASFSFLLALASTLTLTSGGTTYFTATAYDPESTPTYEYGEWYKVEVNGIPVKINSSVNINIGNFDSGQSSYIKDFRLHWKKTIRKKEIKILKD